MKKIPSIFISLWFALIILSSCNLQNSPKSVAKDFMEAIDKQDYEKAKELGTAKTKFYISKLEGAVQENSDKREKFYFHTESIEWGKTLSIEGKAVVYYKDKNGKKKEIELKKEKGKWKVDLDW